MARTPAAVMVTYDPSQLMKMNEHDLSVRSDFRRARRFLEGTWPKPLPPIERWDNQRLTEDFLVIDGEWQYDDAIAHPWDRMTRLDLVGFYQPGGPVIQFHGYLEDQARTESFLTWLREAIGSHTVVCHNAVADLTALERFLGITYQEYRDVQDTMMMHAVRWAESPHDLEYIASIYGEQQKLKHLAKTDPLRYNAGDVVETANAYIALREELRLDRQSRAIYEECMLPLIPIVLETERRGLAVNKEAVAGIEAMLDAKVEFARKVVQAYVGFECNPNSSTQMIALLKDEGIKVSSLAADKVSALRNEFLPFDSKVELTPELMMERIDDEAHPILEARAFFIQADKQLSAYIRPLYLEGGAIRDRVYPRFLPTAQDNGRWSTTNPPLAQLPGSLGHIFRADPGWPRFKWDWAAIELRILAAMSGDELLLEGFKNGWDLHTLHFCEIFGYPYPTDRRDPHKSAADDQWRFLTGWQGKEDKRRTFSKAFVFRLCYGGHPRNAGSIPGANKLGVEMEELIAGSYRWLAKHPAITTMWSRFKEDALQRGEIRDFHGRRRVLMVRDPEKRVREALNMPFQSGCSMVFNKTLIAVKKALPDARFVYGVHDAMTLALPEDRYDEYVEVIKPIVARVWNINGREILLDADFKDLRGVR